MLTPRPSEKVDLLSFLSHSHHNLSLTLTRSIG
jgi:hypothetical protein